MLLNAIDRGQGDRVALLLHGMMGSAESWHRVIPELTSRGVRVLALDLPGHGLSPRDPQGTADSAAAAVVETVRTLAPDAVVHAIGHSYGGTVLAAASEALYPALAIYVDVVGVFAGGGDRAELVAQYERDRSDRTAARLRDTRPFYSEQDAEVEAQAAERFDPETAASVSIAGGGRVPQPGSIVVRANPSRWVTDDDSRMLRAEGVDVRDVPGASHSLWYSHFDEFLAALPEFFAPAAG